ncbi:MAG: NH(3)-dependent NAD(+) synthetase [Thermotogales bacterium 46_20]|nr:MAG: NH(3)-dependent NAD(+) synthetase [Thermotogales bacterium 46_20]
MKSGDASKHEIERIISFIEKSVQELGSLGAVIGISGGIDSAVSVALAAKALGKRNVLGLLLPERDTPRKAINDALSVCKQLDISCSKISVTAAIRALGAYKLQPPARLFPGVVQRSFVRKKWAEYAERDDPFLMDLLDRGDERFRRGLAFYRAKNRIRMCRLYLEAETRGYAVVGATNKTEYLTGLYVKWGDEAVDIEPILHLLKTEVLKIARELNLPDVVIQKAPSADLIPGLIDQDTLGLDYNELDEAITRIEDGYATEEEPYKRLKKILSAASRRRMKALNLLSET